MNKEKLKLNSLYGQMYAEVSPQIRKAIIDARNATLDESVSAYNEYDRNRVIYGHDCILTQMAEGDYMKACGKLEGLTLALLIINKEL